MFYKSGKKIVFFTFSINIVLDTTTCISKWTSLWNVHRKFLRVITSTFHLILKGGNKKKNCTFLSIDADAESHSQHLICILAYFERCHHIAQDNKTDKVWPEQLSLFILWLSRFKRLHIRQREIKRFLQGMLIFNFHFDIVEVFVLWGIENILASVLTITTNLLCSTWPNCLLCTFFCFYTHTPSSRCYSDLQGNKIMQHTEVRVLI